jgi:hypothetical protein
VTRGFRLQAEETRIRLVVRTPVHRLVLAVMVAGLLCQSPSPAVEQRAVQPGFAAQIADLSEPPGYFDTDNLISNERSYADVLPDLERTRQGGVYIGVGPDQNFSYIAVTRPATAFIVDVRRDNLLLHLLFKALFGAARTRADYLALLCGRPVPAKLDDWKDAPIERLARYIDETPADARRFEGVRADMDRKIAAFGVPLSPTDAATIDRFHRRFVEEGLSLRFQTFGRPPQSHYPTYRELLLAREPGGRPANFLASEAAFQFVRELQARDAIVPVVGNLAGEHALAAIGRLLARRGERLSVVYASNVEQYLFRAGSFDRFARNLTAIPHDDRTIIIRSVFGGWEGSTSQVRSIPEMLRAVSDGRVSGYRDLVIR